jgi:hypothetical protein
MTGRQALLLGTSVVASFLFWAQRCAAAESAGGPIVRIAELEIDPGQLDALQTRSQRRNRDFDSR